MTVPAAGWIGKIDPMEADARRPLVRYRASYEESREINKFVAQGMPLGDAIDLVGIEPETYIVDAMPLEYLPTPADIAAGCIAAQEAWAANDDAYDSLRFPHLLPNAAAA